MTAPTKKPRPARSTEHATASPSPPKPRARATTPGSAAADRLAELKGLLVSTEGLDVEEIARALSMSIRNVWRYLRGFERDGLPLRSHFEGKRKLWRLERTEMIETIEVSYTDVIALLIACGAFESLEGTGINDDLRSLAARLAVIAKKWSIDIAKFRKKYHFVTFAPIDYTDRAGDMGDVMTALRDEHRLEITHRRFDDAKVAFKFDPYTVAMYKQAIYLIGYSHREDAVTIYALSSLRTITWLKGEKFEYPKDHDPEKLFEGHFGIHLGDDDVETNVRLVFVDDPRIVETVKRRTWHSSQRFEQTPRGLEMAMRIAGKLTELPSVVMAFGDRVQVLEPRELRENVGGEIKRAAEQYADVEAHPKKGEAARDESATKGPKRPHAPIVKSVSRATEAASPARKKRGLAG